MTVLGTETALRVEQEVQADSIAVIVATDSIRGRELVEQHVVGGAKRRKGVVAADDLSGKRSIREPIPIGELVHDMRILKR